MPQITITATAEQAQRVAVALGKAHSLVDVQGEPRAATAEEVRQFLIGRLRQLVVDVEGAELQSAAMAAIVVPEFNPT